MNRLLGKKGQHPAGTAWDSDVMSGSGATILCHEDDSHTLTMESQVL